MPKTVRIYGMAKNLGRTPPAPPGVEVWCSNAPRGYQIRHPQALNEWTRWFNLHSRKHMDSTYPAGVKWYQDNGDGHTLYFQKHQPDIPGSVEFPGPAIQDYFSINGKPNRYFTCSVAWFIAFAIMLGFERIELWGFALTDRKRIKDAYSWERPCFFYWVQEAQRRGIEVTYQEEIHKLPFEPGSPDSYDGTLYGYETKPEE